jgi:hypothetical protein
MQVRVKSFDVNMEVKSSGIEFEIRTVDGTAQLGDCYLTMTGLIWCAGKVTKPNGIRVSWTEFMGIMKSQEAKDAAVEAAQSV